MSDKIINVLVILIFCSGAAFASKTVPLPGLINPDSVTVDKNRIYITDGAAVSIYSREDFKLIKKFGKKGEGPREFKVAMGATAKLKICTQPDQIIVNSIGRVSFFTKDGNYIKEIYRKEYYFQANKRMNLIKLGCGNKRRAVYSVCRNKLFVEGENDIIHVFDEKGEKVRDIKQDYEKLKIPETRKAEIMDDIYTHFTGRLVRKIIKEKGYFPDRFPARIFTTADDKIYIPTYRKKEGKNEFIIFDIEGKLLKKVYVPLKDQQFLLPYPYTVKDGTLFQLVENEETEEWELHINSF